MRCARLNVLKGGAMDFGSGLRTLFFHLPNWKEATVNLVCTQIYHQVRAARTHEKTREAPILVLQLDNCVSENKNRYLFGFLALLVYYGWYRCIKVQYLVTGHTHCAIDRDVFSHINAPRARSLCVTPAQLLYTIPNQRYKLKGTRPTSVWINDLLDFKGALTDLVPALHGITSMHYALIAKPADLRLAGGPVVDATAASSNIPVMVHKRWGHRDKAEPFQGDENLGGNPIALLLHAPPAEGLDVPLMPKVWTEQEEELAALRGYSNLLTLHDPHLPQLLRRAFKKGVFVHADPTSGYVPGMVGRDWRVRLYACDDVAHDDTTICKVMDTVRVIEGRPRDMWCVPAPFTATAPIPKPQPHRASRVSATVLSREPKYNVEQVLSHKRSGKSTFQFLVRWEGHKDETWQSYTSIRQTPAFQRYIADHKELQPWHNKHRT
jgi:hypothetical protein